MKVFDKYSDYYDLLYADKNYQGEVNYIHQLIEEQSTEAKTILDLGCGTGKHDFYLANLGYQVDGVDFSATMIDKAKNKLNSEYKSQQANLSFEVGDIRNYRNDKKYDVVISLFHVMSYQATNEDLIAAFETAKAHLKKGGIFIFDYWYGPGVLADAPVVRVKRLENESIQVTRIAEPIMYADKNCVDVGYNIFIKNRMTQEVDEIKEIHRMRYLFLPEIANLLGYTANYKWLEFNSPTLKDWNAVSVYFEK